MARQKIGSDSKTGGKNRRSPMMEYLLVMVIDGISIASSWAVEHIEGILAGALALYFFCKYTSLDLIFIKKR
jgi:hypothetical protein